MVRIRVRRTTHHHKATHHKATTHHHKKKATTHKKKTGTSSSGSSGGSVTISASDIVNALMDDPAAMSQLSGSIASSLFSGGFAAEIIQAIEAVVQTGQAHGPGRRLAGTVSTLAGALQGGSGSAMIAMVFLQGATTAVPVYVPSHLIPDIATGQSVWVEPVNGRPDDLWVVGIRAYTATPTASQALTNAATAQTAANNAQTAANNAQNSANNAYNAAYRGGEFVALNTVVYSAQGFSGTGFINVLTTSYGVPAGAKAIVWLWYHTSATVGASVQVYLSTNGSGPIVANFGYTAVANIYLAGQAIIPVDGNGYFSWQISSGDAITAYGRIIGYFI